MSSAENVTQHTQERERRCEGRDDEHATSDDGAALEERLAERVAIDAQAEAFELAGQVLEDLAGARVVEEIAEDILAARPKAAGSPGLAQPIVLTALGGVDQNRIGLADLLEALAGLGSARVAVRVPLQGEAAVGAPDLVLVGLGRDAQDLVVVLVSAGACHPLSAPFRHNYRKRRGWPARLGEFLPLPLPLLAPRSGAASGVRTGRPIVLVCNPTRLSGKKFQTTVGLTLR